MANFPLQFPATFGVVVEEIDASQFDAVALTDSGIVSLSQPATSAVASASPSAALVDLFRLDATSVVSAASMSVADTQPLVSFGATQTSAGTSQNDAVVFLLLNSAQPTASAGMNTGLMSAYDTSAEGVLADAEMGVPALLEFAGSTPISATSITNDGSISAYTLSAESALSAASMSPQGTSINLYLDSAQTPVSASQNDTLLSLSLNPDALAVTSTMSDAGISAYTLGADATTAVSTPLDAATFRLVLRRLNDETEAEIEASVNEVA